MSQKSDDMSARIHGLEDKIKKTTNDLKSRVRNPNVQQLVDRLFGLHQTSRELSERVLDDVMYILKLDPSYLAQLEMRKTYGGMWEGLLSTQSITPKQLLATSDGELSDAMRRVKSMIIYEQRYNTNLLFAYTLTQRRRSGFESEVPR